MDVGAKDDGMENHKPMKMFNLSILNMLSMLSMLSTFIRNGGGFFEFIHTVFYLISPLEYLLKSNKLCNE